MACEGGKRKVLGEWKCSVSFRVDVTQVHGLPALIEDSECVQLSSYCA